MQRAGTTPRADSECAAAPNARAAAQCAGRRRPLIPDRRLPRLDSDRARALGAGESAQHALAIPSQ
eukprot:13153536-Alexandrium_andersonii.AAC.1